MQPPDSCARRLIFAKREKTDLLVLGGLAVLIIISFSSGWLLHSVCASDGYNQGTASKLVIEGSKTGDWVSLDKLFESEDKLSDPDIEEKKWFDETKGKILYSLFDNNIEFDGDLYENNFDMEPHLKGYGHYALSNGVVYFGAFYYDRFHGFGYLSFDNVVYQGEFSKGMMHGVGMMFMDKGIRMIGYWKYGTPVVGLYYGEDSCHKVVMEHGKIKKTTICTKYPQL
eukprot:TRINITY_DN10570_c0_g1_i4.p1 TRINITY_DN10570_c0_g1~~TRINITY_DN10570_c0_g1_i4.p1  ORF type:complete len:227 (-),score=30.43 TRINITY_DN10570_c0_g1_i4:31-711(-)